MNPLETVTDSGVDHQEMDEAAGRGSKLHARRLLIRASAGTGKTYQLSSRYLSALRHAPPERILATTFTRKAAGEILERVLLRLAEGVTHKEKLKQLSDSLGGATFSRKECLALLANLTRQLHRVRISTLDGFYSRLATAFSMELGLPTGWSMLDEVEAKTLQDMAISDLLGAGKLQDTRQLMQLLDKGQSSRSVHDLIASRVETFYALARRAPAVAWERFPEVHFLAWEERQRLVDALESFTFDDSRMTAACRADCEKIHNEEWPWLVAKGLCGKVLANDLFYYNKPIPPDVVVIYRQIGEHIRAAAIEPWAAQTKATRDLLYRFHERFQELKRETRGLQFDDVTHTLAERLREQSPKAVAYRMDGGIEHLLLDEFQDTSPVQWDVLRPFALEASRQLQGTFFCVGDKKQAIYGWRGGEAAIFEAIEREIPGLAAQGLDASRRSSHVIMEAVNKIFRGLPRHDHLEYLAPVAQQWSHDFPEHRTALDLPGYACLRTSPAPLSEEGELLDPTEESHLQYTAKYIQRLLEGTAEHSIGVLVRRNATIGKFIFELNRLGIAASEEGGNPLTDSAAVQLVLSLLQLADHPGDTVARFHLARSQWGPVLGLPDFRDDVRADVLSEQVRRGLIQHGYSGMVHAWLVQLAPFCDPRELRRLQQLEELADRYSQRMTLRPQDFAEFVRSQKVQDPQPARVRVMTVHQAKGLEFDEVVLAELDVEWAKSAPYYTLTEQPLDPPSFIALQRDQNHFQLLPADLRVAYEQTLGKQFTESLCVLYVALTRAVHGLHLIIKPRVKEAEEKHLPKTYAGLLRAALAPERPLNSDTLLFETGNRQWFADTRVAEKFECSAGVQETMATDVVEPVRIVLAQKAVTGTRRLARVAPSLQEGERLVRLSHMLPLGNAEALDRGTLFHAWFEQVKWLDEARPNEAVLRQIAKTLLEQNRSSQGLDIERCLTQFHAYLRIPQIAWALSRRAYQNPLDVPVSPRVQAELGAGPVELKVITERRFAVQVAGQLISGSIDRLVLISRNWQVLAAEILDFKTDALPADPQALQERIEFYRGQLQSYVRAVSQLHHLEPERISARLVLLGAGRVETVQPSAL